MPAIQIRQGLWKHLLTAAEKQHKKPELLANQAVQDFLLRMADEELLVRSEKAARHSPLSPHNTESAIRNYRRTK
jgi:hypothetical protein